MLARRAGRTAALAQTVAIAMLVAGAVIAVAYGAQRVVLRSPAEGELLAAKVEGALLRYRYVKSVVHIEGEPTRTAECLEGWEPGRNGRPSGRGARILFSDGERLILGARRVMRIKPGDRPSRLPPTTEVKLAGCTRSLTNHIYTRLVTQGRPMRAERTTFSGRAAYVLRVKTRRDRFTLYVDAETLGPRGLSAETRHAEGFSEIYPMRLTPAIQRDFRKRFDG
jgi:hypothetical protein